MSDICVTYEYTDYTYESCQTAGMYVASAALELAALFLVFALFSHWWRRVIHKVRRGSRDNDSGQGPWTRSDYPPPR